jgi:hypothetical protein
MADNSGINSLSIWLKHYSVSENKTNSVAWLGLMLSQIFANPMQKCEMLH